jgi:ZIP family zinc transporter
MPSIDWIVWTSGAGCAAGGLVPVVWARAGEPSPYVHGFAAGTLLGAGLLVLIPEAAPSLGPNLGVAILVGFLGLYIFDRWLLTAEHSHGHGHAEAGHAHHLGALAVAGFTVHTFADGAALGLASSNAKVGVPVLLGTLFHEVPAQFVFARLLIASGVKRVFVFLAVAAFAASMIGAAVLVRAFSADVDPQAVSFGLATSAGMFLFLATAELLPREHRGASGLASSIAFFAGTLVSFAGRYLADGA